MNIDEQRYSQDEIKKHTDKKLNELIDYKIIVSLDYYLNVLPNNPFYWSYLCEGTMKGEPDIIHGNDVYFIGAIIDATSKIGVYVFADEFNKYHEEQIQKYREQCKREREERLKQYNEAKLEK